MQTKHTSLIRNNFIQQHLWQVTYLGHKKGFTGDMLLWGGQVKWVTSHQLTFGTCIGSITRIIVNNSGHTLFLPNYTELSPQTGVVQLLFNTLIEPTLLFPLRSGMCDENKNKTSIFKIEKKSYIHIDNNVKFKMYKSSKSLQSEKSNCIRPPYFG